MAVPLAVVAALICLYRRRPTEAAPFLLTAIFVWAALLLVYWNAAISLRATLIPVLGRILIGLVILAWLLLPLLLQQALDRRRLPEEDGSSGARL